MDELESLPACPFCGYTLSPHEAVAVVGIHDKDSSCILAGFKVVGYGGPAAWKRRAGGMARGATDGSRFDACGGYAATPWDKFAAAAVIGYMASQSLHDQPMLWGPKIAELAADFSDLMSNERAKRHNVVEADESGALHLDVREALGVIEMVAKNLEIKGMPYSARDLRWASRTISDHLTRKSASGANGGGEQRRE